MSNKRPQTKPDVYLDIATYKLNGCLNEANAKEVIKRIENHMSILRSMRIKGLLISFEGVAKIEKVAFILITDSLSNLYVRLRIMVGFCGYSSSIYPILRNLIKNSPLGLYKSPEIMSLAIGSSNIHRNSSILVHAEDLSERQFIASTLLSNNYFVIMALSKDDFKKKITDKNRYNKIIADSYFSNTHDDVIITFDEKTFTYKFQGTLDKTLKKKINIDNFLYRLTIGYNVLVFDFTNIYNIDLDATKYLMELENIAKPYSPLVCCIGFEKSKIDLNSLAVLEKSSFWLFDNFEHIYEDQEVIQMIENTKPQYSSGLTKKLLELSPHFLAASMQTLDIYEILDIKKTPAKQVSTVQLYRLNPKYITHIIFSGDFNGELIFFFSKGSVETILKNILIDYRGYQEEDYLDTMSEFVNSITGTLKSNIRKKDLCIQFTLPYSTTKLDDILHENLAQTFILNKFSSQSGSFNVALSAPIDIDA